MRLAARLAARGGHEVRVPARRRELSALETKSAGPAASNVELDHHVNDAPPRAPARRSGPGSLDATRARGREPLATGSRVHASPSGGQYEASDPILAATAHRSVYGAGVSRGGLDGGRSWFGYSLHFSKFDSK